MRKPANYNFIYFVFSFFIFILACTPTSRYKILSVFLDGVPNPENQKEVFADSSVAVDTTIAQNNAKQAIRIKPKLYFHKPYNDKLCGKCHNMRQSFKILKPSPQLCYDCHENLDEKYPALHGPVAMGACETCHEPHKAKTEKLLVRDIDSLCVFCHEPADVFANQVHKNEQKTSCLTCHNPHGGDNSNLLKRAG